MKIAVLKENRSGEQRVALSPQVAKNLIKAGFECAIESGAGYLSNFSDEEYKTAGASISPDKNTLCAGADISLKVNPFTVEEVSLLKSGSVCISFLYAKQNSDLVEALAKNNISAFSMDAIPRISKAQSMDALSSQSNLAGYKAVLIGANALGKIFPLMMTAAGTVTPSKVLIFGAGVAGLQAIATAKRLGAVVEATDVRPETKEQVESLGGKFIEVEDDTSDTVKTEGGYAKNVSDEFLKKQREVINKHIAEADLVITTALVMGKKAPVLISKDMVELMKLGSVIVDMAVEQGGNCELSQLNEQIEHQGVTIIGQANLPSLLPNNASELYAKNISTLLLYLADSSGFKWEMDEEITKGTLITHQGSIVHPSLVSPVNA